MHLTFYLGIHSGRRTGEIAALRMSDLGYLADGVIRACIFYDGPLREDKNGTGNMKWVAAEDAEAVLGPLLAARRGRVLVPKTELPRRRARRELAPQGIQGLLDV